MLHFQDLTNCSSSFYIEKLLDSVNRLNHRVIQHPPIFQKLHNVVQPRLSNPLFPIHQDIMASLSSRTAIISCLINVQVFFTIILSIATEIWRIEVIITFINKSTKERKLEPTSDRFQRSRLQDPHYQSLFS